MENFNFIKRAFMANEFAPEIGNESSKLFTEYPRQNIFGYNYYKSDDLNSNEADIIPNVNIPEAVSGAIGGSGLYLGAKHVPGALGSFFLDKPGETKVSEAYKNIFDKQFLQRLPGIKRINSKGGRSAAALATALALGAGVGALSDKASDTNTILQKPSFIDKTKDAITSDTAKTLGLTGGGAALGAILGNLLKGEDGSKLLPILLGLLGAGTGYAYANKEDISNKLQQLFK